MNGTHCFQMGHLGVFWSEFISVNGTHCSQIGHLDLFSEFFFLSELLAVRASVPCFS